MTSLDHITINFLGDDTKLTPAQGITWSLDTIGPPAGGHWQFMISRDEAFTQVGYRTTIPLFSPSSSMQLFARNDSAPGQYPFTDQTTIYVTVQATTSSNALVAQGQRAVTWDATSGLAQQIAYNRSQQSSTPVALTATDEAHLAAADSQSATMLANWETYTSVTLPSLQDVLNGITGAVSATVTGVGGAVSTTIGAIFSGKLLDLLTTFDAGGGITCDPIDTDLSGGNFYGVIVHCDTVPDFYAFTSPGDSWCPRDLAVLTISRGGAILLREGIHTRSHMVYPLPGVPAITMEIDVPFEPPAYNVRVDWGEGVCGRLLAMELP